MFDSTVVIPTTPPVTFSMVSREGFNTQRNETTAGVASDSIGTLVIKHDADPKKKTKPNRRVVSIARDYKDTASGVVSTGIVHVVFTQPKGYPDADIQLLWQQLEAFITPNVAKLLVGGN